MGEKGKLIKIERDRLEDTRSIDSSIYLHHYQTQHVNAYYYSGWLAGMDGHDRCIKYSSTSTS